MATGIASGKRQSKLSKLIQEKRLAHNLLVTLQRENLPGSNSREQKSREEKIEDLNRRLIQLDKEINREKYHQARSEAHIENLSKSLLNLSVEDRDNKLNSLRDHINQTQEMVITTSTITPSSETEPISSSGANTQTTASYDEVGTLTSATSNTAGSQNLIASSTPKTSSVMTLNFPKPLASVKEYNLPPYESPEQRESRLEREKYRRETFDHDILNMFANMEHKQNSENNRGTIPKNRQPMVTFGKLPNPVRCTPPESRYIPTNINDYANRNISLDETQPESSRRFEGDYVNQNISLQETRDEFPRRFENYNPTPMRMRSKNQNENQENLNERRDVFVNQRNMQKEIANYGHHSNTNQNEQGSNMNFREQGVRTGQMFDSQPEQDPTVNSNRMQETVRTSFLKRLKLIPKFSGDTYKEMKDFLDISGTLYCSCANEAEEREFYEHLVLQLRGECKSLVNNLPYLDFELIKDTLLKYFAHLSNKDIVQSQIENLHQEKKETLTEYTERVRKLLKEKNLYYNNMNEEQRSEQNRLARRAFVKGIKDRSLREKLLIRGASSLEDAIAFSIEAENDARESISNNELFCGYCRTIGHRTRFCDRKENRDSDIGKLITALRTVNNMRPNIRNNNMNNFRNGNFVPNRNYNVNGMNRTYGYKNNNYFNRGYNNYNGYQNRNNSDGYQNRNNSNGYQNRSFNNGNGYGRNQYPNSNGSTDNNYNRNAMNRNQNNNNGYAQNRHNMQPNPRNQQRTSSLELSNNFLRNARINSIQTDLQQNDQVEQNDNQFSSEN